MTTGTLAMLVGTFILAIWKSNLNVAFARHYGLNSAKFSPLVAQLWLFAPLWRRLMQSRFPTALLVFQARTTGAGIVSADLGLLAPDR